MPWLWRAVLLLTGLFMLPMLLIRAQADDDTALRAFLTPADDCPAPCFMGIRPGETTLDTAIRILSRDPTTMPLQLNSATGGYFNVLQWRWTEAAPAWLDARQDMLITLSGDIVSEIQILTRIPWGDFLLAYGRPAYYQIDVPTVDADTGVLGWSSGLSAIITVQGHCRAGLSFYHWPVGLRIQAESPFTVDARLPRMTGCR